MILLKYWKYFVVTLILAGLVIWFVTSIKPTVEIAPITSLSAPSASVANIVSNNENASGVAKQTLSDAVKSAPTKTRFVSPLYDKFKNASDFGAVYFEFAELAASNPEAQYFQATILRACTAFVGPILQRLETSLDKTLDGATRKAALSVLKKKCSNVPVQAVKVSSTALMRDAATRGDIKSQAYLYRFEGIGIGEASAAATSAVRALALSQDPIVIENLEGYFNARNKLLEWNIPSVGEHITGAEMAFAFNLAACDLGYECGALSLEAQIACAYRGYCDAGGREALFRNNLLTPNSFSRVQGIREVILRGFTTGNWPDGFWSGSSGVKRK